MTADQLWPVEAREAAARALAASDGVRWDDLNGIHVGRYERHARAVLAALSVHAVPCAAVNDLAQQWEQHHLPVTDRFVHDLRALAGGNQ